MLAPFQALALHAGQDFLTLQYNPLALSEPLLTPVTFSASVGKHLSHCHLLSALTSLPSTIQLMTLMEAQKNQKPLCHPFSMHLLTDLQTRQVAVMGAVTNQNPNPDPEPDNPDLCTPPGSPDMLNQFLGGLQQLAHSITANQRPPPAPQPEKVKVCNPDTFNGLDPQKLCSFLVACNLHFQDHPYAFPNDEKKSSLSSHTWIVLQ
jgi:hypothetical protein